MSEEVTNDELPEGWARVSLSEIASNRSGNSKLIKGKLSPERTDQAPFPGFSASGQDVWLAGYDHEAKAIIVSAVGARCGKAFEADGKWSAIANTHIVRPNLEVLEPKLFWYLLNDESFWEKGGSAQPFVKVNKTFERLFNLPPLAEQKRIADKLEVLLGRVDACRARLDLVPALLKRFRQSVLAAAMSGKLTEGWREEKNLGGATRGILIGEDAINVPASWEESRLRDILDPSRPLCYGVVQPGDEDSDGARLVRVQDMERGSISVAGLRTISKQVDAEYKRSRIREGDLVISIVGTIGRTAIVPAGLEANIARAVARIACREGVESRWVNGWLSSDMLQWWLTSSSKEVARKTLNLSDLAGTPIAIPSFPEQQEIVRRVEALLAFADRIQSRLVEARKTVERLTPASLAKAFRGELVSQDPNDEPAVELLSKLNGVKSSAPKKRKSR